MSKTPDSDFSAERFPNGRRRQPLGTRTGGAVWNRVHDDLALTALRVLAERGYDEMVMDDVAEEAGVSKRTVYRHYPAKLDLALAAIQKLPTYANVDTGSGSMESQVRRYLESTYKTEALFPQVLATAVVCRNTEPALLEALKCHVLQPREAAFAAQLKRGQESGEIDPSIKPAAIAALSIGMQIDHFTGMHPWTSNKAGTDYAMSIIWPLIRAR